jgi:hypothetical protein
LAGYFFDSSALAKLSVGGIAEGTGALANVAFFVITEGLIHVAGTEHRLFVSHPMHSLTLPILCAAPLGVGVTFGRYLRKASGTADGSRLTDRISTCIATYAALVTVIGEFMI